MRSGSGKAVRCKHLIKRHQSAPRHQSQRAPQPLVQEQQVVDEFCIRGNVVRVIFEIKESPIDI